MSSSTARTTSSLTLAVALILATLLIACSSPEPAPDQTTVTQIQTAPGSTATSAPASTPDSKEHPSAEVTAEPKSTTMPTSAAAPTVPATQPEGPPTNSPVPTETQPPDPTATTAPPLPNVPTMRPAAQQLINSISDTELDCLNPDNPTTQAVTAKLFTYDPEPSEAARVFQCLNDDSQYLLYRANSDPDTDFLEDSTHRCIWEAVEPLFVDRDSTTYAADDDIAQFIAMTIAMLIVPAYCMSADDIIAIQQQDGDTDPMLPTDAEDIASMRCVIDHYGGPAEFVNLFINTTEQPDDFLAQAEAACSPTPNP